jgi:hypothetical protein
VNVACEGYGCSIADALTIVLIFLVLIALVIGGVAWVWRDFR